MLLEQFQRLALALAIGFLVGVERGWRDREAAEGQRTAGIRTYALSGLLGGVAGSLSLALGGWIFAALALPFAGAFILFKYREQEEESDYSVTGIVAALLVFALGAYATVGDWQLAAAAGVVVTGLLAFKRVLHGWLQRLTWPELRSALILLAMSFVALPLLPNRSFGPYGSVNPAELWLLTIAIAGISFLAYAAIRIFGASRGALLASATGALVSSTAVTFYLARLQRTAPNRAHVGAALVAGAVMAARLCVIALALSPPLFQRVIVPLGAFAVVSVVLGLAMAVRDRSEATAAAAQMKSPFDLLLVLKFAVVLGSVMAAAKILTGLYGASGLLATAAVAGLADVDAVSLAAARMTAGGLDPQVGAYAMLIAAGVDSASKAVLAAIVGGPRFGAWFAGATLLAAGAAAALYWWVGLP